MGSLRLHVGGGSNWAVQDFKRHWLFSFCLVAAGQLKWQGPFVFTLFTEGRPALCMIRSLLVGPTLSSYKEPCNSQDHLCLDHLVATFLLS